MYVGLGVRAIDRLYSDGACVGFGQEKIPLYGTQKPTLKQGPVPLKCRQDILIREKRHFLTWKNSLVRNRAIPKAVPDSNNPETSLTKDDQIQSQNSTILTRQRTSKGQEKYSTLHIQTDATLTRPVAGESPPGSWPSSPRLLIEPGPDLWLRNITQLRSLGRKA